MSRPERVVLIGPSGAGKSALGRALAGELGYELVDTDAVIEARIGMTIDAFFARFGEPAFRAIEREVVAEACRQPKRVIATGGGVVLDPRNWAAMRPGSAILGLTAEPEKLVERVRRQAEREGEAAVRPLLAGDAVERMRAMLAARGPLYRQADVTIDTGEHNLDGVIARAMAEIERLGRAGRFPALSIETPLERSDLYVGHGARRLAGELIRHRWPGARRVWTISDENVAGCWLGELEAQLREAGLQVDALVVSPGEGSKSLGSLADVLERMTAGRVSRSDVVVALGGGVVGDLAGFVAASCLRGLSLMQIPTSLLAMVDSSVGGKTGVNTAAGKNMVGAFYQPGLVLIDPNYLETLPRAEYRSGMAEVIKHAWIQPSTPLGTRDLIERLDDLASLDPIPTAVIADVVRQNVMTKHSVVQADERESGLRMILNFGHTAGHAIEADGYRYRHGEAVGLGMLAATHIGVSLDLTGGERLARLRGMLERAGLPVTLAGTVDGVLEHMQADKKNVAGVQRWILPSGEVGVEIRTDVEPEIVREALAAIGGR